MTALDAIEKNQEANSHAVVIPMPDGPTNQAGVERYQAKAFDEMLGAAGVPPLYRGAKLETNCRAYEGESGKRHALEYAGTLVSGGRIAQRGHSRFCLLLAGDFGTGKTWLGTAAFKELIWKNRADPVRKGGVWRKFHQFVREVQQTYDKGGTYEVMQRFQQAPLLMLDDVGDLERDETDHRKQLLYEVLDYRNDWMLTTILTTNLSQDQLIAQFGERTWNRLLEMCALVEMKGKNLRIERPA